MNPKWRVYKRREGFWRRSWIVQPPFTDDLGQCYAFSTFDRARRAVADHHWREWAISKAMAR